MNIYLLQFVSKWFSLFVISLSSLFGVVKVTPRDLTVENENKEKNQSIMSTITKHDTEIRLNNRYPSDYENILQEGQDRITYIDGETKEEKVLQESITEIKEVGNGDSSTYTGKITGYGPDCEGCSTVGNVACFTREHTNHSLIYDGITYTDTEYGEVRILAADHQKFPCGTIVYVESGTGNNFMGIVLDTGSAMRNAWREYGIVWMDVAFASEKDAFYGNMTGNNATYTVKRWGY